jgi:hypothetical protein
MPQRRAKRSPKSRKRQPRTKSARRPRRAAPKRKGMQPHHARTVHQICSITDPFCTAANGAKFPDLGSSRTLALQSKGFFTVTAPAGGFNAMALDMDYIAGPRLTGTVSGAVGTTWSTSGTYVYSGVTGLPATCLFRVVSAGITIKSTTNATSNSGSMGILSIPGVQGSIAASNIDCNATTWTANTRTALTDSRGLSAIVRSDGHFSHEYANEATPTTTSFISNGNDVLVAYLVGASTGASIEVTYYINWEFTFPVTSTFNALATPAAINNPTAQTGSNAVKRAMEVVVPGGTEAVKQQVHMAASGWLKSFLDGTADSLVGPVGSQVVDYIWDKL